MKLPTKLSVLALSTVWICCSCGSAPTANKAASVEDAKLSETPHLFVLGDSLSSGVMSETKLGNSDDFRYIFERAFVKFGSSLYAGIANWNFDEDYLQAEFQNDLSKVSRSVFFTENDWGIRGRIAKRHGIAVNTVGVKGAFAWGKRYDGIDALRDRLDKGEGTVQFGPQTSIADSKSPYVALSLGGNDFCSGVSRDLFKERLLIAMEKISHNFPGAHLILMKLPDFVKINAIDFEYKLKVDASQKLGKLLVPIKAEKTITSCKSLRKSYCSEIENNPLRWQEFNSVIDEVLQNPTQNGFLNISSIESQTKEMTADLLSVDCFHPSEEGHKTLGEALKWHTL